jgi:serpin B
MRSLRPSLLPAALAATLLTPPMVRATPDAGVPPMSTLERQVTEANQTFAVDLYRGLAGGDGNLIFSPTSVALALAMTAEGARGETEAQMSAVLHLSPLRGSPLEEARRKLLMAGLGGSRDCVLRVANRIWLQSGYPLEPAFREITAKGYGAEAESLDFARAAEASRKKINRWIEEKTNGRIVDLLPSGLIDSITRLVLTNAIYFKGTWARQFDKKATLAQPFFTGGSQVTASLMFEKAVLGYAAADDAQMVSLPYRGNALEMVVIVPDRRDGLAALERRLAEPGRLDAWLGALNEREVALHLPRFKSNGFIALSQVLSRLGMPLAFDGGRADFSGIAKPKATGEPPLYIKEVVHKAFIEVNEEGTEAAAATGVIMAPRGIMRQLPTVRADHPFLYMIRERTRGSILFMGRIVDPTAK